VATAGLAGIPPSRSSATTSSMAGPMARAKVDFRVVHHGTVYLLYPNTLRAKQWVKETYRRTTCSTPMPW
jgi:hypothetical protein